MLLLSQQEPPIQAPESIRRVKQPYTTARNSRLDGVSTIPTAVFITAPRSARPSPTARGATPRAPQPMERTRSADAASASADASASLNGPAMFSSTFRLRRHATNSAKP